MLKVPATIPHSRSAPAIEAKGLGKRFKLYRHPWARAMEWAVGNRISRHDDFWALRDVSLQVHRGESVGILGRNGSGKSTLLKLLTGTLSPTEGTFSMRGRVLSLLELGTGLNPDLTGRQNVVHNASLMRFPQNYARDRMAEIEDFSELGDFLDRPMKVYSSGMTVRLAFSMFACFEPDIFIVDEALSVGDVFFQQKCAARIQAMLAGGTTMLFVSHDMGTVTRLCQRAILLEHGRVVFHGDPNEAASRYFASAGRHAGGPSGGATDGAGPVGVIVPAAGRDDVIRHDVLPQSRGVRHGAGGLVVLAASLRASDGGPGSNLDVGAILTINLLLQARRSIPEPTAGLHLFDRLGNLVFGCGTRQLGHRLKPMAVGDEQLVRLQLTMDVQPGDYVMNLGCGEPSAEGPNIGLTHDRWEGIGPISVRWRSDAVMPFYGIARLAMAAVE